MRRSLRVSRRGVQHQKLSLGSEGTELRRWLRERAGLTQEVIYPTPWHRPFLEEFCRAYGRGRPARRHERWRRGGIAVGGGEIRTRDLLHPKQARSQAAPRPAASDDSSS